MCKRGEYLMRIILLLALAAGEAMPHPKHQHLEVEQTRRTEQRLGNEYTPIIHISSTVLHVVPDEQTHLLLPSKAQPAGAILPWQPVYRLEDRTSAEPRLKVSDNVDIQEFQRVKSHG